MPLILSIVFWGGSVGRAADINQLRIRIGQFAKAAVSDIRLNSGLNTKAADAVAGAKLAAMTKQIDAMEQQFSIYSRVQGSRWQEMFITYKYKFMKKCCPQKLKASGAGGHGGKGRRGGGQGDGKDQG